jgi:hypothetical protein
MRVSLCIIWLVQQCPFDQVDRAGIIRAPKGNEPQAVQAGCVMWIERDPRLEDCLRFAKTAGLKMTLGKRQGFWIG